MFKLLRFYSVTSFVVIFLTAALLTLFYRQVTIHWIEHLARSNNLAVAQTALNAVGPELAAYLDAGTGANERGIVSAELPAELSAHIRRMTQDTTVSRIEIFNRNGLRVYSTHAIPGASAQARNPAFLEALDGRVSSSMVFRDIFNRFRETSAADNLMQTYSPIRGEPAGPVLGVFETHTDMSHLIAESDMVLLSILAGGEVILAVLYAILFLVVRHARNIISAQQEIIKERTMSLEILSEGLLKGEESKKKKIAAELHEGLAQTLSAIKINVEHGKGRTKTARIGSTSLDSIVPVLQNAIQEVRTIATELRPSSLDDLGLLPTLNWFCREFERQHPEIRIQREISLPESMIPSQLKIEIYRIIESAFKNIAKYSNTDQIRFVLRLADDMIHLVIGDSPAMQTTARCDHGAHPQFRFAEIKERTSLSGGAFSTIRGNSGWVTLHSSWACAE